MFKRIWVRFRRGRDSLSTKNAGDGVLDCREESPSVDYRGGEGYGGPGLFEDEVKLCIAVCPVVGKEPAQATTRRANKGNRFLVTGKGEQKGEMVAEKGIVEN